MTISTLANLETQVLSFMHRAQILDTDGTTNVRNLVELGELWLFRNARTPEMEATLSAAIGSNGILAVPSDYLSMKHCRISGTPTQYLKMRPAQWIYEQYPLQSANGKPHFIARDGSGFIFGPYPDSTYTVTGTYYAKPTSIVSSANSLFTTNPDLYLFAALAETEAYVKNNPQVAFWIARRDALVADINQQHGEGQYGTGMAVRPDVTV